MSLIGALYPSVTALGAFGVGTQVIAHNLANVATDRFKASRTLYQDLPPYSGVGAVTQKLDKPPGALRPAQGLPESRGTDGRGVIHGFLETSNTDVALEMIGLILTSRAYQANTKPIQATDEMLGTIINIKV
ncbi:MAG: flagellar biosynthesis protein FlgG [Deltaproteobacteria bacterium]|jgi:flagellar hook protein FlgE|nr:flagellar biosynthesis protein FlgG [Deltaproteobacteria bacterium]